MSGVREACEKQGGQEALGAALGVSQQAVSKWVQQGFVPFGRVSEVSRLTGVPRRRLCDPSLIALVAE